MIRRVLTLTLQSLRAFLRSRFAIAVLVLLALVALVLPRSLHGDGTPAGEIRMLLTWTLGAALLLLSVATLWAGCSAFAGEIEEGVFASVAVTPARRFELWLGKWLGLVALDALLLAGVLLAIAIQLPMRDFSRGGLQPLLRVPTSEEGLRENALAVLAQARAAGQVPEDAHAGEWFGKILEELRDSHWSIGPGETQRWRFELPARRRRADGDWRIRVSFTSPVGSASPVSGNCRVLNAANEEVARLEFSPEDRQQAEFTVSPQRIGESPTLSVLFENTSGEDGMAVLVGTTEGVALFIPQGTFSGNLLRAGLVLWTVLASLAAIGITAGALFSLPVAVFAASAITLMGLLSHSDPDASGIGCGHDHGDHGAACGALTTLNRVSTTALRALAALTDTVDKAAPLDRIGDGLVVTLPEVLRALAAVGLILPIVTGCGAVLVLRHREFP